MFCTNCGRQLENPYRFCAFCGNACNMDFLHEEEESEENIIRHYFKKGFTYEEIRMFLETRHNIMISLRTLKTRLAAMGLKRRNVIYDINNVRERIQQEINGPGCSGGYRSVWHTLRLEGMQVPRQQVQETLKELDPEGCEERRAKCLRRRKYRNPGPNHAWHMDGYDKLKPYGFPIHGCIDGFSRRILWLEMARTNNDPAVVANFYLKTIVEEGGCPTILRTDNGTENVVVAGMQCFFRCDGTDDYAGVRAHRYGTSPANQRIESWWSYLRKNRTNWWINFFKDMIERGLLNTTDPVQMECLWFCFSRILQKELNTIREHWNSHYIRQSRYDTIAGKPDVLFYLPESVGAVNHIKPVTEVQIQDMSQYCEEAQEHIENVYQEYFKFIIENELRVPLPTSWSDAYDLYQQLLAIAVPN